MQDDAGSSAATWSVPGSLAEPEVPVAPLEPPALPQPPGPGAPAGTGRGRVAALEFAATGPLAATAGGAAGAAAVPALQLHPMTLADILDGALAVIKARPARILGVAAVFVVPIHLLLALLQRNAASGGWYLDALTSDDPAVVTDAAQSSSQDTMQFWATLAILILPGLALMLVAVAMAHLVGGWSAGRDHSAQRMLAVAGRRWWAVVASFVLIHLAEIAGCYLGTVFIMALFAVTAPVIGAEGVGPLAAMNRAANLALRRFWPTLGISLAIGLVATLLGLALGGLPVLISAFFDFDLAWPLQAAGGILGALVSTPFVATATVLLYLDLRIRTEGLDIELAAVDLAHDAP